MRSGLLACVCGAVIGGSAAGDDLLVSDFAGNSVLRFDAQTGAFIDTWAPALTGGIRGPHSILFDRDGNVLVVAENSRRVVRFLPDGTLVGTVTTQGLVRPVDAKVGDDGLLYVMNANGAIHRYDHDTGALVDEFVPAGVPDSLDREFMRFGPDIDGDGVRDLLATAVATDHVHAYSGADGAYLGAFTAPGAGGMVSGQEIVEHGGLLYVVNGEGDSVLAFDATSGAFDRVVVATGAGGIDFPHDLIFLPDGSLAVTEPFSGRVTRFDPASGDFLGEFITQGDGGIVAANSMLILSSACAADLDGDGDADADDFFAYLDAFSARDLGVCDQDGDGDCDADDFFAYLDVFSAGCG